MVSQFTYKYLRFLGKLADYANCKFRPSVMFPPKLHFSNNFGGLSVITQKYFDMRHSRTGKTTEKVL
jgi:hypothetical protein